MNQVPCVLAIGGTDPSGGAGIQADIKAISATGCYAAAVVTALVAQNTQTVSTILEIPPDFFSAQVDSVCSDLAIAAIKIGMLYTPGNISTLSILLKKYQLRHVVLDPVLIAKNGSELLPKDTIKNLTLLFSQCELITPNIPEAEQLSNEKITSYEEQVKVCKQLANHYQTNFLLKGGHLDKRVCADFLFMYREQKGYSFHEQRIDTRNTHGTGCSLSSAIASYLAQGCSLREAVKNAKVYLTHAIRAGSHLAIGKGQGPVDHFWYLRSGNDIGVGLPFKRYISFP